MVGWNGTQASVLPRQLPRPMGLASNGSNMAAVCKDEVMFFADAHALAGHYPEEHSARYDALFLPRASYFIGSLDAHDIGFGDDGLWMVNTRFSCLSVLSRAYSFEPRWHPPFISRLAPEDRCHLNGLAILDGKPRYVTAHGTTDEPGAWRESKADGGVLIDVESGECAITGLSMPHSPRYHDGKLYMLNSGAGELCLPEPEKGEYEVICALPGYTRGMSFAGKYALVGLSQVRSTHLFDGMGVQGRFGKLHCGVAVVDLESGKEVGIFEFTDGCDELYDVLFLQGLSMPSILNHDNPASKRAVTAPDFAYWLYEKDKAAQSTGLAGTQQPASEDETT